MLSISVGPLASLGCVDLYNALIKLRPEWEAETLKVVMTGSAEDGPDESLPVQLDGDRVSSTLELPFTDPDAFWKLP